MPLRRYSILKQSRKMQSFTLCFAFVLLARVTAQASSYQCLGVQPYNSCSTNSECGCIGTTGGVSTAVCARLGATCSTLAPCKPPNNACDEPGARCVYYTRCGSAPVCYPKSMLGLDVCPLQAASTTTTPMTTSTRRSSTTPNYVSLHPNANWTKNGTLFAGNGVSGDQLNQLNFPGGIAIDETSILYVADSQNNRVMQWMRGASSGRVVAGGNDYGNGTDQLNFPTAMIFDAGTNSLIICDEGNQRVVRWSLSYGTKNGEVLIEKVNCMGLAMDTEAFLYVSDGNNHEVRRYELGKPNGTLVAGGNGKGNRLNQLSSPYGVFVDKQRAVYVADHRNHRVMKWANNAKEGVVVAGGRGSGSDLSQVSVPTSIFLDDFNLLYVADFGNERVVRWRQSATQGTVIAGGYGSGSGPHQMYGIAGLTFDKAGNLYVAEHFNNRVQRFDIGRM